MRAGRALRRAVRCGVAGRAHGRLGNRPAVRRWGWAESDWCLDWRAGARRRVVTHAVDVIFGERMAIKPHGDEHRSYGRKGALGSLDGGGPPPSKLCPASHEAGYAVPPFTWWAFLSRLSRGGLLRPATKGGVFRKRGHETEGVGSGAGARGGRAMDRRGAALLAMTIHWGMTGVPSGLSSMTS